MFNTEGEYQVREKLVELLTEENAEVIADYIIGKMEKESNPDTLEFEFTVKSQEKGGGIEFEDKNVWFKFDIDNGTKLDEIRRELFAEEPSEADMLAEDDFKILIGQKFIEKHKFRLSSILRKHMFQGKIVPIRPQSVYNIDMLDFSSMGDFHNYQLIVHKKAASGTNPPAVAAELMAIHDATHKPFDEILAEKHAAKDPKYANVEKAEKKKYLWECQIDFVVDFF